MSAMSAWFEERIVLIIQVIAAALAVFWGGLLPLVQLLLILMALDIASGIIVAIQMRKLSSEIAWKGVTRKAMILLLVVVAGVLERYAVGAVGTVPLQSVVAAFYCAGEAISIVENAALAGLPVPEVLKKALAKLSPEKHGTT